MEHTLEKFDSVVKMLQSTDEENIVLALTLIEQLEFKENLVFILLAKKNAHCNNPMWEKNAPVTFRNLKAVTPNVSKVLTFKKILQILVAQKVDAEQMQFYLDVFAKYLKEQITAQGMDFVEDIEMKIKIKQHELV